MCACMHVCVFGECVFFVVVVVVVVVVFVLFFLFYFSLSIYSKNSI